MAISFILKTHTYKFCRPGGGAVYLQQSVFTAHFLPRFFSALICLILSNPSTVKCSFLFIISATSHQSENLKPLLLGILYFFNNGIIIFIISLNFVTRNYKASRFFRNVAAVKRIFNAYH